MTRIGSGLLRVAALALVAVVLGPVGNAMAEVPNVAISSPGPGAVTNNPTPLFSGEAEEANGEVTLAIYYGSSATGFPAQTLSTFLFASGGVWELVPAHLADGTYTAQAEQTNPAFETGKSSPVTFTVDTASPKVTLNQPTRLSNDKTPFFSGTASESTPVVVHIYSGSPEVSKATATGTGGSWTSTEAHTALSDGEYTAVATQESSFGNPPGESSTVTFTVDTASPTVTLEQPAPLSKDKTPSFTGSASETTTITVQIYAGATATGLVVSTATASGTGGGWTSGHASPALSSGEYTALATQPSSLGNPAGVSAPVTFTVDTASPTVTLNQPESPSNETTPSFTGSASETTAVTVDIYAGSTAKGAVVSTATATGTGADWTSGDAGPALSGGQYTAVAVQQSSLGNPAGVSSPVTFIVDTASPAVSLNQPLSPSKDTTPSFTGSASETTPVAIDIYAGSTATGPVVSTTTATGTGGGWTSGRASPALSGG